MTRGKLAWGVIALLAAWVRAMAWVPDQGGVWPDGAVPVVLEFDATAPNANWDWNGAAREAMGSWNIYMQRAQLTAVPSTGHPAYDNGRNELFFDPRVYGEAFPGGVLAVTLLTTDKDQRVEADVVFNSSVAWSVYYGPIQTAKIDFRRVTGHELGHVLGLGHPDEAGQATSALMNSVVGNADMPVADDQIGISALYGSQGSAPRILALSGALTVKQGASATLSVRAGGRGPLTYQWSRDGVPVAGATGADFNLAAAAISDAGSYTVKVGNAIGSVTSGSILLTVLTAVAPTADIDYTSDSVESGADYTISAHASGDYPMRYEWKRDGQSVGFSDSPSLTIRDAQFSDAGSYTMTASNAGGSATTRAFVLQVRPGSAPSDGGGSSSGAYEAGRSVSLIKSISGTPPLTLQWKKDGIDLPGATTSNYYIGSFQAADAGSYTVTATNRFGQITTQPIAVQLYSPGGKPIILDQPTAVAEYPGATVSFGVTVESNIGVAYRWFKDGVLLSNAPSARVRGVNSASINVGPVIATDAGVYAVEVTNSQGATMSTGARLEVLAPVRAVFTQQPSPQSAAVGATVNLTATLRRWFADYFRSGVAPYTYQWFKDGVALPNQTNINCSFTAKLTDAGRYFLRVTTDGGVADSDTVDVSVTEGQQPWLKVHPPSTYYDSSDDNALRLAGVGMTIWVRRNVDASLTKTWSNGVVGESPFSGYLAIGTYTLTVSLNGASETSRPFTLGYQPAIKPVIGQGLTGHTVDVGQSCNLYVNAVAFAGMSYQWQKDGVTIPGATGSSLNLPAVTTAQTGSYRVMVTSPAGSTLSEPAVVAIRPAILPSILVQPMGTVIKAGLSPGMTVTASGGALSYQWKKDGVAILGATDARLGIYNCATTDTGDYSVVVTNAAGSVESMVAHLTVTPASGPPVIDTHPVSQSAPTGGDLVLVAAASGSPVPGQYQWQKDGVDIPGATDMELRLHDLQLAQQGSYTVVVTNTGGSTTSRPAILTVDPAGRLVNISARAYVGAGDNILIAGFVVTGTQPRTVLVRGIGDQLTDYGVTGVLRNPSIRLFDSHGALVASCDDWYAGSDTDGDRLRRIRALRDAEAGTGAFPLRTDTRDAALLTTLAPGAYSAQVFGAVNTTGVALAEVYEVERPSVNRLVNLSSRSYIGTGSSILISGVVVGGQGARKMLFRGVGPGLTHLGVTAALTDPMIRVYQGSQVIGENQNWGEQAGAAAVAQASAQVGASVLEPGSKDAALLLDLPPGAYSVQVFGANGETGVALAEAYEVPN